MKTTMLGAALIAALAFAAPVATAPAAAQSAVVYVKLGPPTPLHEVVIAQPSPAHIWIAGYHTWNGSAYVWVPGRWELPPAGYHYWVAGHWKSTPSGWYWKAGHWKR